MYAYAYQYVMHRTEIRLERGIFEDWRALSQAKATCMSYSRTIEVHGQLRLDNCYLTMCELCGAWG